MRSLWHVSLLPLVALGLSCGEIEDRGDCDDYLSCLDEAGTPGFSAIEEEYGEGGSCWTNGDDMAEACRQACSAGLDVCELEDDTDTDTDTDSDTDTDCDYDPGLIYEITAECNSSRWHYEALVGGWTTDGQVDLTDTSWEEEHPLPSVDYDLDGCWDRLSKDLPIVTDWSEQDNGVNSLFPCSGGTNPAATWMIRVWDEDGVMSDCAVWGKNPGYYSSYDCRNWN